MSIRTMTRVWKNSTQAGGKLLLLLAIADFANDDGMAFPGIDTLAKKTRQNRRTVQRQLSDLEEKDEIAIEPGTGRSNTNTYWVLTGLEPSLRQQHIEHCQMLKGDKMPPFNPDKKGGFDDIKGGFDDKKRAALTTEIHLKGGFDDIKGDIAVSPEPLLTVIKDNHQLSKRHEPSFVHKKIIQHFKREPDPINKKIVTMLKKCRPRSSGDGTLILQSADHNDVLWMRDRLLTYIKNEMRGYGSNFEYVEFEDVEA